MPNRVRKRKKSASPDRAEASHKRTHQESAATTSNNSPGSGSALPTSTDYRFRLKVISSSLKVADEIFEEAVQGLAQICFPKTILDELGVEVIASHMHQGGAPRENIDRMRSIFPSVMVQQVACMLAQYTDTPEKLESAISAVADASRVLHEQRLSSEAMSGASKIVEDTLESYNEASESSKDEAIPPREEVDKRRKQDKKSKRRSKAKKGKQQDTVDESSEHLSETETLQPIDVDGPASTNQNKAPMNKERKVSKSWRWDVDSKALAVDEIPDIFKRTSDLFAYHALPVVQQELGSLARKKEIRKKIQSILVDMSDGEYEPWVESFRNLNGGDTAMLERVSPEGSAHRGYIARATPTPTSRRPQRLRVHENGPTGRQQDSLGSGVIGAVANPVPVDGPSQVNIKRERC